MAPTNKPIQILLVEDSPSDAALTLGALELAGIPNEVSHVQDGVEAIEFLRHLGVYAKSVPERPDLILLDLNLPCRDGREVLEEIKADRKLRSIPVIVLSTSQSEQDILRAYHLGANCYVVKPINFERFLEVIKSVGNFWLSMAVLPSKIPTEESALV
jgi:chemotaxis family two-component system response regulator Rcp1